MIPVSHPSPFVFRCFVPTGVPADSIRHSALWILSLDHTHILPDNSVEEEIQDIICRRGLAKSGSGTYIPDPVHPRFTHFLTDSLYL